MTLDNGTADPTQSNTPYPRSLSCRRLRKPVSRLEVRADSHVFHAEAHPVVIIRFSSNQQIPRAIIDGAHGIRSIAEQVLNHLLQLDGIAYDERVVIGKFRPQDHAAFLKFAP